MLFTELFGKGPIKIDETSINLGFRAVRILIISATLCSLTIKFIALKFESAIT